MSKKENELFETEWTILKVVWDNEPCAAPSVQEALKEHKDWTYGTVKTLMDRMVKKGLLTVEKVRNLYLYRAAISRAQARQCELAKTIKRAFDGAFAPLMQFLVEGDNLSDQEIDYLQQLLKDKKKDKRSKQ